ncbi:MAG: ABC transporter permease [bacterium]|nr:ABC transporter permease [bacterium]
MLKRMIRNAAGSLGGIALLWRDSLRYGFRRPSEFGAVVAQMDEIGVQSLVMVALFSFFVGMVLAVQVAYSEANFAGRAMIGIGVALAITREFGPLLTALLVGGRVTAGITSVIGSMAVTEQIDAIRLMGASPAKKLVFPRMTAAVIVFPLLTLVADVVGILGGLVVSLADIHMTFDTYLSQVDRAVDLGDFLHGMFKAGFFGFFVSLIGCHYGLAVTGGAEGVGRSVTRAVVASSICVIVSDYALTKLLVIL